MNQETILVIGSGGREAAIVWKLIQSKKVSKIFVAPGNSGMEVIDGVEFTTLDGLPIKINETSKLIQFAKKQSVGLTVVGPEGPLCSGIVDDFRKAGLAIFGPNKSAAQMEGSKVFAKEIMLKCGVPTAAFQVFTDFDKALKHVVERKVPMVIKADGQCGGKGVYVCRTLGEARDALTELLVDKKFGKAGTTIIVEDFLEGYELSFMAVSDGKNIKLMIASQDHKQRFENDEGPMTGGMGAFAPVPWVTEDMLRDFSDRHILSILSHLQDQYGTVYTGCLYIALMYTADGFQVLEWNARPGDPETQVVLPLMQSDLFEYMLACTNGTLGELPPFEWHDQHAVCIVLCEDPYPQSPEGGQIITQIDEAEKIKGVIVLPAGFGKQEGSFITAGGRVANVICVADSLEDAQKGANQAAETIKFDGKIYRRDIGNRPTPELVR